MKSGSSKRIAEATGYLKAMAHGGHLQILYPLTNGKRRFSPTFCFVLRFEIPA